MDIVKLRLSRHAKLQLDQRFGPQLQRGENPRGQAITALEAAWDDRQADPPKWYRKSRKRKSDPNIAYVVARICNVDCVAPVAIDRRLVITVVPRNVVREAMNVLKHQNGGTYVVDGGS